MMLLHNYARNQAPPSKENPINNGILKAPEAMPFKDLTSDGNASFSIGRHQYAHTITAINNPYPANYQQKKWIGGCRDASQITANQRVSAVGLGSMNSNSNSPIKTLNTLVVDSNLLHFYTFNNNDLSGNYLKNIATNQYELLIDTGVTIDETLNIPSSSDTIGASIISNYTLNSSGITIGLWFKPILPFNSFSRIFSLQSTTGINNDSIFIGVFIANKLQLTVNNGGTATSINLTNSLTTDTLYFLCWVITPTSWTLYINGDKTVYTSGIAFPTNLVKNYTYLGKYSTNSNNITGFIDNFFIYNNLLTDSQITDIYSKGQSPSPTNYYYTIPIQPFSYRTEYTPYQPISFKNVSDNNTERNARQRARSGGAVAPLKKGKSTNFM